MQIQTLEQSDEIYTVSRLNNEIRLLLEDNFTSVWVEGEISNFAAPHSGHWYFSLKDSTAQVRCAMFRGNQRKLNFVPKDGSHVLVKARVSLYETRGEYQLIVDDMEERGEGKLRRAFEILKKKLESAGLFDEQHKKPIPQFPKRIGVITSATGAAIRDILTVLQRRYPCVPVIIYPTLVQGDLAAANIVQALQTAARRKECDVLIIARGGGSLEDLWPFNEEIVARAIFDCHIPTISGVGHEVDFTIADFVADIRAATPSAAAEIAVPYRVDLLNQLSRLQKQIIRLMQQQLLAYKQQLTWTQKHLQQQHPKRRLLEKMQHLDFCEVSLVKHYQNLLTQLKFKLSDLSANLRHNSPLSRTHQLQHRLGSAQQQLINTMSNQLNQQKISLTQKASTLNTLSPLATLERGYAIATTSDRKQIVRQTQQVKIGDKISLRLLEGELGCEVKEIKN